jgi:hypothetical protein
VRAGVALPLALLALGTVRADQPRPLLRFDSPEAEAEAKARRARIEEELRGLEGHPWAGEYRRGMGLGFSSRFSLSPATGYVAETHSCTGLVSRGYGSLAEEAGALSFHSHLAPDKPPMRFLLVRWGERSYLVHPDDLVGFCNEVNSGWEPRTFDLGGTLLRTGDEQKPAPGDPTVNGQRVSCVLAGPVQARVTDVGPEKRVTEYGLEQRVVDVTLDIGRRRGILPGMWFDALVEGDQRQAKILDVDGEFSRARIQLPDQDRSPPPRLGDEYVVGKAR